MNIIPPINSKGLFKVESPFDNILSDKQEYTVTAIRSLTELEQSNENPLDNIYIPLQLTEADYKDDLDNEVVVVTFVSTGGKYIYVPADRILSMPEISGYKYQEKVIAINLGSIPMNLFLDTLLDDLTSVVKEYVGVTVDAKLVDSSAIILVNEDDHNTFTLNRNNNGGRKFSYKTLYEKEVELNEKLRNHNDRLECWAKENCDN